MPVFAVAMAQLTAMVQDCCRARPEHPVFVAHNGRQYDSVFLAAECLRTGVDLPNDWLYIDTLPWAKVRNGE